MNFYSRLVLGTVQLGMPYGIANRTGQPSLQHARAIVAEAAKAGIAFFDTAQAYGESEEVLGQCLPLFYGPTKQARVITKLSSETATAESAVIRETVALSLRRLRVDTLFGLMLHDEKQLPLLDGSLGALLAALRGEGLVSHIGCSVYSTPQAIQALEHPLISIVQVPGSILDRRFEHAGVFERAVQLGKQVHVRSIFMQGVLFLNPPDLPMCLQRLAPFVTLFRNFCARHGCHPAAAALIWAARRWPQAFLLFGAETAEQVRDNIVGCAAAQNIADAAWREMDAMSPPQDDALLNPSLWKRQ